jgi:copper chaperone CopZ
MGFFDPKGTKVVLKIDGMTCGKCPVKIEKALDKIDGIKKARASYRKHEATVIYDEDCVTIEDLKKAIAEAGDEPGDYELVDHIILEKK